MYKSYFLPGQYNYGTMQFLQYFSLYDDAEGSWIYLQML